MFGAEVFGEDGKGRETQRGWRRAMELAEMEHETRVHEIEVEVGEIRGEFLQVMKQSEKVSWCLFGIWNGTDLWLYFRCWIPTRGRSKRDFCKLLFRSDCWKKMEAIVLSAAVLDSDSVNFKARTTEHIAVLK